MRKLETYKRIILLLLSGFGILIHVSLFFYFWKTNFSLSITAATNVQYYYRADMLEVGFYFLILCFLSKMYGGMRIGYLKNAEVIFSQIFAILAANFLIYAELSLMAKELFVIKMFLIMTLLQIVATLIWNNVAYWIYKSIFRPRKMLLIHGERPIEGILNKFSSRKDKYDIVKCLPISTGTDKLIEEIGKGYETDEYHAVVIWDIPHQERNKLLKYCYAKSIRVYLMPKITDVIVLGAEELHLFDTPILLTREYSLTMEQRFVKRMIDIICSGILVVLASPIMLITAIAIKLYDGGPVLYKQVRCTKDQREFKIMKFRSMKTDAEKDGVARLATKNDDRITPIGKFIRKVRIDELPQLVNIIKGDMSFVGPRPPLTYHPWTIDKYTEEQLHMFDVRPGITGWAQINGRDELEISVKAKFDGEYAAALNAGRFKGFAMDVKCFFGTIVSVLRSDGVVEGGTGEMKKREEHQDKE